jgi:hypothetical protein
MWVRGRAAAGSPVVLVVATAALLGGDAHHGLAALGEFAVLVGRRTGRTEITGENEQQNDCTRRGRRAYSREESFAVFFGAENWRTAGVNWLSPDWRIGLAPAPESSELRTIPAGGDTNQVTALAAKQSSAQTHLH